MKSISLIFYIFVHYEAHGLKSLGKTFKNGDEIEIKNSANVAAGTYVINHEYCLAKEDKVGKETLEEVHTYARLKYDPHASLPSSFTICSAAMTTYGAEQRFFMVLGKDGNVWLRSRFKSNVDKTRFGIGNMLMSFYLQYLLTNG